MAFAFNFARDTDSDLEDNGGGINDHGDRVGGIDEDVSMSEDMETSPKQSRGREAREEIKAREVGLDELLDSLPSAVHYRTYPLEDTVLNLGTNDQVPTRSFYPRRELQDIRTQIMAEEDPSAIDSVLQAGLSSHGDLSSGLYEGGFKTWECSYDLAGYVRGRFAKTEREGDFGPDVDFIELGAGTGLPSSVVLDLYLRTQAANLDLVSARNIVLADYNDAVLRLATFPNIFLTWYLAVKQPLAEAGDDNERTASQTTATLPNSASSNDEDEYLEIGDLLKLQFKKSLSDHGINLTFVSGSWSPEFVNILNHNLKSNRNRRLLIAASETIYAPQTLSIFTDTVLDLLRERSSHKEQEMHQPPRISDTATALIAAKQIYFGVGGGVEEFKQVTADRGALVVDRWLGGKGVGRWIGEIKLS